MAASTRAVASETIEGPASLVVITVRIILPLTRKFNTDFGNSTKSFNTTAEALSFERNIGTNYQEFCVSNASLIVMPRDQLVPRM
jgi:hypothetical protein